VYGSSFIFDFRLGHLEIFVASPWSSWLHFDPFFLLVIMAGPSISTQPQGLAGVGGSSVEETLNYVEQLKQQLATARRQRKGTRIDLKLKDIAF